MKKADRPKIIKALNMDLGLEIGAIVQYLYHHVMAEGMESPAIIGLFEKIAKDEMEHMETLACIHDEEDHADTWKTVLAKRPK